MDYSKLYTIYKAFYKPDNMLLVVAGDFNVEEIIKEIKSRIVPKKEVHDTKRI